MKRHRIIIPKALQNEILLKLYASHQGTEKTKLRARSVVYWRDLNRDIDNVTKSCSICQELQSKQAKEPLMPTEIPPRPWHTVGSDLFYLDRSKYLLVADYYSKFTFAGKILPGKSTSKTVIELMKQIFSEHGIPHVVRSDNGPHYHCYSFTEFAQQYGFKHVTSSPHFPFSNGFIESQVKTTKKTLKKAKATNSDPYLALMCLRSTPIDGKLPSPAELLLGRPIQDNLPRRIQGSPNNDDITERLEYRQERQRHYHDRGCRSLPDLAPGQAIRIQDPVSSTWKPAMVKEKPDKVPRSYSKVTTPAGQELRRNRRRVKEAPSDDKWLRHQASKPEDSKLMAGKETQNPSEPGAVTRSGRTVKPPERYGFSDIEH